MATKQAGNKPGRPNIGRRRIVIVGDDQWQAWREAAKREDTSIGVQVRRLMDEWAEFTPKQPGNAT